VRLAVFESAAKHKQPSLVFTWACSHPDSQPLLGRLLKTIEPYDVEVMCVHTQCSQPELERRMVSPERQAANKAFTIEALHRQQRAKNHVEIPEVGILVLDTTALPPDEEAQHIIDHHQLTTAANLFWHHVPAHPIKVSSVY
jgi:hypothetical protein